MELALGLDTITVKSSGGSIRGSLSRGTLTH